MYYISMSTQTKVYEILKTKGFSEKEAEEVIDFVKGASEEKLNDILYYIERIEKNYVTKSDIERIINDIR